MAISERTRKLLWRYGAVCAFTDCDQELVAHHPEGSESVLGEEVHIVAQRPDGPRGENRLSDDEKSAYRDLLADLDGISNLTLMCPTHHTLVDSPIPDAHVRFPVSRLLEMKLAHQEWLLGRIRDRSAEESDLIQWATIVEAWSSMVDLDDWGNLTFGIASPNGVTIREERWDRMNAVREWMLTRIYPQTRPGLEEAFMEFRLVLECLCLVARYELEESHGTYRTAKWYKRGDFDQARRDRQVQEWEYHTRLASDLAAELTRSANRVIDRIRATLLPSFRDREGYVLFTHTNGLDSQSIKLRYSDDDERFVSLQDFAVARGDRDFYFGPAEPIPRSIRYVIELP